MATANSRGSSVIPIPTDLPQLKSIVQLRWHQEQKKLPQLSKLSERKPGALVSRLPCLGSDSGPVEGVVTEDTIPLPIVHIDQYSDPHATVVEFSFGDRLTGLLETMKSLKELGLNVVKGSVAGSTGSNILSITRADTGRKVEDPELLESIRLTIISDLLQHYPECSEKLAMGEAFGKKPPKKVDLQIATQISIVDDGPTRSLLTIETVDKPGLLLDIVEMITATSVTVESAEIDTEGLVAKDKFHVSYGAAALSKPLAEVLVNCLRFHLRRSEIEDESY